MSITLATDLDRTLFPNGNQPCDNAMPLFRRVVEAKRLPLIFVTGRHLRQIEDGIREYGPPLPDMAIAEVGTRLYRRAGERFEEDTDFVGFIQENTRNWDLEAFKSALDDLPLRLQPEEHQNRFKLSFFVDDLEGAGHVRRDAENILEGICPDAHIIWSVDETLGLGMLDVLPAKANKMEALEYVRRRREIPKEQIIYCGDSGNDIIPLTGGYNAIVVANAIDDVRAEVKRIAEKKGVAHRVYFARGSDALSLNGNYVSGIIEGLLHFGIFDEEEWKTLRSAP